MVSDTQRKEIKKRMRRIKDAKKDGKPQEVIKKRTAELYQYLERQGMIDIYDE